VPIGIGIGIGVGVGIGTRRGSASGAARPRHTGRRAFVPTRPFPR